MQRETRPHPDSQLTLVSPASLPKQLPHNLTHITIVQCDFLKAVPPLPQTLVHLNLSGNRIEKIEKLVVSLQHLDLSANLICKVEGLKHLINLAYLDLSGNSIQRLEGIEELQGPNYKISTIKLQGNEIFDLRDIARLAK